MSGLGGFFLGAAQGAVGAADQYLAEERKFGREMSLQEWQHQKKIELEELKRAWSKEDFASASVAAEKADQLKRSRDVADYKTKADYDAAIEEAKANNDHARARELEILKAGLKGPDKEDKESLSELRKSALFDFAQKAAPDFDVLNAVKDPEKADWKTFANELRVAGKTEEAQLISSMNRELQAAKDAEAINTIFEAYSARLEERFGAPPAGGSQQPRVIGRRPVKN